MTGKELLAGMSFIDEELMDEALNAQRSGKRPLIKWAAAAAALILAAAAVPLLRGIDTPPEGHGSAVTGLGTPQNTNGVVFAQISTDWPYYRSAAELVEHSDLVVEGKVTGISFALLDMTTGLPPAEGFEAGNITLHTIYDVDVTKQYKGKPAEKVSIRMFGGLSDRYIEEQIAVIGSDKKPMIPVCGKKPNILTGETYLFMLAEFEGTSPTLVNLDQSVYDINAHDKKTKSSIESILSCLSAR